MTDTIVCPDYIRIVERKPEGWGFKKVSPFYSRLPFSVDFNDLNLLYGISKQEIVIELFRLNGGRVGFYLADLRNKRYYYCGAAVSDIKTILARLGIGQADRG